MTYLFLGEDGDKKKAKILELKQKLLPSDGAQKFDYEVLYGNKLDSKDLQKALIALPAIAKKRFVIIYTCHKLSAQNKKIVVDFVSSQAKHLVLALESNEMGLKDSFVKKVQSFAKVIGGAKPQKANVFDMTRAMTTRRHPEALKILSNLLEDGNHPLQIMGGIVWFWGRLRQKLPQVRFEQGLLALEEADLNIKRSRIKQDYALEVLVTKLCVILG